MKKLTQTAPKTKRDSRNDQKRVRNTAETTDAKCCAKTSKNRVGCHD